MEFAIRIAGELEEAVKTPKEWLLVELYLEPTLHLLPAIAYLPDTTFVGEGEFLWTTKPREKCLGRKSRHLAGFFVSCSYFLRST